MDDTICNAIIESVSLKIERGFILDSWVSLDYGGSGQGFGGFVLGGTDGKAGDHTGPNFAAEWIVSIMRAADVEDWAALKGKAVRVKKDGGGWGARVIGVGHITRDDRWFYPERAFDRLRNPLPAPEHLHSDGATGTGNGEVG